MDMRNTGSSITRRMKRVFKGCPKAFRAWYRPCCLE
jgi:hypothetical protein